MKFQAAFAVTVLAFLPGQAFAVSAAVKEACSADYAAYCSQHKVGSSSLKTCMRAHRKMLNASCVAALGHSSEVSQQDIEQYKRETR